MVAVWTQTLMSAAEISNFFSALAVVICFMCMVIFIMRIQGIQFTSPSVVYFNSPTPVQVDYQKIQIPFMCYLKNQVNNEEGWAEEIHLKITSDATCDVFSYWCVPFHKLINFINLSWNEFEEKLHGGFDLNAKRNETPRVLEFDGSNDQHVISLCVGDNSELMGEPPRENFPLVVILIRKGYDRMELDAGALISVIHVSDKHCPMPSAIIYQYLKQYSGHLTQLQTLYTQRTEQKDNKANELCEATGGPAEEDSENEEGSCVICRIVPPTRALLPCRHVCICVTCFGRLSVCPLCRSRVTSFFVTDPVRESALLREAEAQQRLESSQQESREIGRHRAFFHNMNSVFNSFLGLDEEN